MSEVKEDLKENFVENEEVLDKIEEQKNSEIATILEPKKENQENKNKIEENFQDIPIHEDEVKEEFDLDKIEPKTEDSTDNKDKKKKDFLHKYTIAITIISVLLFIGLVIFSTVFGLTNRKNDKIVNGIYIKGIEVSGLTYEEAKEKLISIYEEKLASEITLKHNDFVTTITPEEIEAKFGIAEAVDMAYSVGRSGKVLKDNYAIINAYIAKIDINPSFSYNEETLMKFINETAENLPDKVSRKFI